MRGPKLNAVLEVCSHQCHIQGDNYFPSPAGHTSFESGLPNLISSVSEDTLDPLINIIDKEKLSKIGPVLSVGECYW